MEHNLVRRDLIKAAGAGLATTLLAGAAKAQTPAAAQTPAEFWTAEYTAKKGDVSLQMYRKRVGAPTAGGAAKPVLFLVHGSSNGAQSSYDLHVPGKGEYSMMNVFARLGYDVWTMDHEGYGKSSRTSGNSDIASGVEDLKAAIPTVVKETGRDKMHMYGTSSGAIRAGAYAMVEPQRVDRLVLSAFTYKGENAPTLQQRAKQLEYYKTHNTRLRDRAMIEIDLQPRRALLELRPGRRQGARRLRAAIRRPGADRHLSRHDLEAAAGRPAQGEIAGADAARRPRRHLHQQGPAGVLRSAPQRRPPVRDHPDDRALDRKRQQPPHGLARDAGVPHHAAAGGVVTALA